MILCTIMQYIQLYYSLDTIHIIYEIVSYKTYQNIGTCFMKIYINIFVISKHTYHYSSSEHDYSLSRVRRNSI